MFREIFADKKGQKRIEITYLGYPGEIARTYDYNGKTYYNIKYQGENGRTAVDGILSTDKAVKIK